MNKRLSSIAILAALAFSVAGKANIVVEPTFQEKIDLSELVFIGTVTDVSHGGRRGFNSTATLSALVILKGQNISTIVVDTYNAIDELDPHCCEVGATYMMFLRPSGTVGSYIPVRGHFGTVRIGGPQSVYRVVPATEH
jgi:hypothetical protein